MSVPSFIASYNGNGSVPPPPIPEAEDVDFDQHYPSATDYTAWQRDREQARRQGWMRHEPPFLHSLKWCDESLGIEHLCCIRASDVDTLWLEVPKVMAFVKASKARETTQSSAPMQESASPQTTQPPAATETPEGCSEHGIARLKPSKFGGGMFCAAKVGDGYCTYRTGGGW